MSVRCPPAALEAVTAPGWVAAAVLEQWPVLLADHANCEKKAASTAIALMFTYADDVALAARLSRLAREELRHFEHGRPPDAPARRAQAAAARGRAATPAALRKLLMQQRAAAQARPAAVRRPDRGALLRALPAARRGRFAAGADGGAVCGQLQRLRSAAFRALPEGRAGACRGGTRARLARAARGARGSRGRSWSTSPTRSSGSTPARHRPPEAAIGPAVRRLRGPAAQESFSARERQARRASMPAGIPAQHRRRARTRHRARCGAAAARRARVSGAPRDDGCGRGRCSRRRWRVPAPRARAGSTSMMSACTVEVCARLPARAADASSSRWASDSAGDPTPERLAAHGAAQFLVGGIAGAEQVAVRQQHPRRRGSSVITGSGSSRQPAARLEARDPAGNRGCRAARSIGTPRSGERAAAPSQTRERTGSGIVVADPAFEQVAEDVERLRLSRASPVEQPQEGRRRRRGLAASRCRSETNSVGQGP